MKILNQINLNDIQALVIDMDGVLWRGDTPLPGLIEFFDFLQNHAIDFVLATNNASKTPAQFLEKLARFGVRVGSEHILTSSLATAAYLQQDYKDGAKVYVVGQAGLRQALTQAGFMVLPDSSQPVDVVVAGIDFELTYETVQHAALLIQDGARFIGTNGDLTFPIEGGRSVPGAGSILAFIQAATGVKPLTIGKPERFMFDLAMQKMNSTPEHTATLGDRLETDILGGQRAGLKTIMVLTGVDNEDAIIQKGVVPDAIFDGIDELTQHWSELAR
ncbi:MAG: HAD-IIA family hydrolase [Anaerolineae bacterium]|nr:HAD-IIA family hydrolase [Anaerolineae bacterium]